MRIENKIHSMITLEKLTNSNYRKISAEMSGNHAWSWIYYAISQYRKLGVGVINFKSYSTIWSALHACQPTRDATLKRSLSSPRDVNLRCPVKSKYFQVLEFVTDIMIEIECMTEIFSILKRKCSEKVDVSPRCSFTQRRKHYYAYCTMRLV